MLITAVLFKSGQKQRIRFVQERLKMRVTKWLNDVRIEFAEKVTEPAMCIYGLFFKSYVNTEVSCIYVCMPYYASNCANPLPATT